MTSWGINVSYVDREDFKWQDLCLCPDYLYSTYTQSDLNMELSLLYYLNSTFHIGVGYTIVRRLNTGFFFVEVDGEPKQYYNDLNSGLHLMMVYHYRRFYAKLMYARRFKPYEPDYLLFEGQDRLDLTVGYELFGGDLKGG